MENKLAPYECQFTLEERKNITAHTLQEIRKAKGYSQKDVAKWVQVKPATFNTYETGRTEPPIEILVRLSYLYDLPVDILIQRDRQYTTAEGLQKMLNEYKSQLQDLDDEPENKPLRETLLKLVEQLSDLATKTDVANAINSDINSDTE